MEFSIHWLDEWLESRDIPFSGIQVYYFFAQMVFNTGVAVAAELEKLTAMETTFWIVAAILTALFFQCLDDYLRSEEVSGNDAQLFLQINWWATAVVALLACGLMRLVGF